MTANQSPLQFHVEQVRYLFAQPDRSDSIIMVKDDKETYLHGQRLIAIVQRICGQGKSEAEAERNMLTKARMHLQYSILLSFSMIR